MRKIPVFTNGKCLNILISTPPRRLQILLFLLCFFLHPVSMAVAEIGFSHFPDTGQTKCYNNKAQISCPIPGQPFYGQDSQYNSLPPAYHDNKNGTVTDLTTDLMWEQNTDKTKRTWREAVAYCDSLVIGEYSNWRLPEIIELQSIVDYTRHNPTINPIFYCQTGSYWSVTRWAYEAVSPGFWFIQFIDGTISPIGGGWAYYVRCIRQNL